MSILGVLMLKKSFNVWAWAGTLIGFGGIGLIANAQPGGIAFSGGAAFVLAAAICRPLDLFCQRKLVSSMAHCMWRPSAHRGRSSDVVTVVPTAISEMRSASATTVSWVVGSRNLSNGGRADLLVLCAWPFRAARARKFSYLVAPSRTLLAG